VHGARVFAFGGVVLVHAHLHIAAAHAHDGGLPLAARAVLRPFEQGDGVAGLQAQHLHMARRAGGQVDVQARGQRQGAVKAWHGSLKKRSCLRSTSLGFKYFSI